MVPTQALYFCATAGQIHTHSSDNDTWPVWGFITFEPECHNTTTTNHLYPQNNDIYSPIKMYAEFPHTIYSLLMKQTRLSNMNEHELAKFYYRL